MNTLQSKRKPTVVLFITLFSIILVYYTIILLHEWGHGTAAWIFGYNRTPFDIEYGGWFLLHVDEGVHYDDILAANHGVQAALIGIAGYTVNIIIFLVSIFLMNRDVIKKSAWALSLCYWSAVFNMLAIWGYTPMYSFSIKGDIGRFVHGLQISPWWIFIPGTLFAVVGIYRLLKCEIIKMYALLPIRTLAMQRIYLLTSLGIIFLFFTFRSFSRIPAWEIIANYETWFRIALVAILFFIFLN